MHERYSALLERASDWAVRLRDQASLEEADSASLKKTIEDAKAEVSRAKERVDAATATQNEFKVARGKLEVQVEAAIKPLPPMAPRARGSAHASCSHRPRCRRA